MPYINGMSPHSWCGYPPTSPSEHAIAPYNGMVNRMPQHTYMPSNMSGNGYYSNSPMSYGMGYPASNMATQVQGQYSNNNDAQQGEITNQGAVVSETSAPVNLTQETPQSHLPHVTKDLSNPSPVKMEPVYNSHGEVNSNQWAANNGSHSIPSTISVSYPYGVETSPSQARGSTSPYKEFKIHDHPMPKLESL